ncbi:MAG: imidazole glycerol phosphate synthase subunit HisH [Syntrophomonadaceae bacterium]|nr:imidazole glycerol phosphate synthase subunit HisH [Syntrophomonadaceae bacterium]
MIAIIDYGMGNLASVSNAFTKIGCENMITQNPEQILTADRVVLPGVGAFADAIKNIRNLGIDKTIYEIVRRNTPLLGVCLGYQLLFSESDEDGLHQGLDIIAGRVEKIQLPATFKVPHMGWNNIDMKPGSQLFADVSPGSWFYFVHSYHVIPEDDTVMAATTDYGIRIVCAVERYNLVATQFHPEKSSDAGLQVLKNFGAMK